MKGIWVMLSIFMVYRIPGMQSISSSPAQTSPLMGSHFPIRRKRADQGHFTIVTLDSNQEWSYKWNTQRLQTQLDPGTYTIYVTTRAGRSLANLGGSSTYKTLEVYLQDTHAPQGESGAGTYTLNPEKHTGSPMPTIITGSSNISASPSPTTPVPTITTMVTTEIMSTTAQGFTPVPATTRHLALARTSALCNSRNILSYFYSETSLLIFFFPGRNVLLRPVCMVI